MLGVAFGVRLGVSTLSFRGLPLELSVEVDVDGNGGSGFACFSTMVSLGGSDWLNVLAVCGWFKLERDPADSGSSSIKPRDLSVNALVSLEKWRTQRMLMTDRMIQPAAVAC